LNPIGSPYLSEREGKLPQLVALEPLLPGLVVSGTAVKQEGIQAMKAQKSHRRAMARYRRYIDGLFKATPSSCL
jgi:hypothetical protein